LHAPAPSPPLTPDAPHTLHTLRDLTEWPLDQRRALRGVFTDIDDTLTQGGRITPEALGALHDLQAAGLQVIAITGRPIGWCWHHVSGEHTPAWPVDAIVAENGAVAWNCRQQPPHKHYQQTAQRRSDNQTRMQAVAQRILREVPGAAITRDSGGRETDLTFDCGEFCHLPPERVAQILAILHAEGMQTSVSSIHIHGCYDAFDKWQGAQWIVQLLNGRTLADELDHWVCIGDSGNDQAMFQGFRHSVGVANIRRHLATLTHMPHYITRHEHGAGFAEMAQAVLHARAQ